MLNNYISIQTSTFYFFFRVVNILNDKSNRKIIKTHYNKNFVKRAICKIVN